MHSMPRVLGFDFGLKRIGVAVGNVASGTSEGIVTLSARDGEPDWNEVAKLHREWSPDLFIVGLPVMMDGAESAMSKRARAFGAALQKHFNLRVTFIDERLSTREAEHLLNESGGGKLSAAKRVKNRDRLAAELIVRSYLNEK